MTANTKLDFPSEDGEPTSKDIPCNICSMLKVRNGRLEWSQIMRSNDVYRGLPYNFIQFTTLQEVLAGWIGVEPGTYTHYADSLHLYDEDAVKAFSSIAVPPTAIPKSLALPRDQANAVWSEMNRRVNVLVERELSAKEYGSLARLYDAPEEFGSLMAVVAADAARRKKCIEGMNEAISHCESPLLKQLWNRWAERKGIHSDSSQIVL